MVCKKMVVPALALLCAVGSAFYLPGVTPRTYKRGEEIRMRVDTLTSIQTLLPYDYYSLPFVKPHREIKEAPENLGEYLSGERIKTSPYHITTLINENCKLLRRVKASKSDLAQFEKAIEEQVKQNTEFPTPPKSAIRTGRFAHNCHIEL